MANAGRKRLHTFKGSCPLSFALIVLSWAAFAARSGNAQPSIPCNQLPACAPDTFCANGGATFSLNGAIDAPAANQYAFFQNPVPTPEQCCGFCALDPRCAFWGWNVAGCTLISDNPTCTVVFNAGAQGNGGVGKKCTACPIASTPAPTLAASNCPAPTPCPINATCPACPKATCPSAPTLTPVPTAGGAGIPSPTATSPPAPTRTPVPTTGRTGTPSPTPTAVHPAPTPTTGCPYFPPSKSGNPCFTPGGATEFFCADPAPQCAQSAVACLPTVGYPFKKADGTSC